MRTASTCLPHSEAKGRARVVLRSFSSGLSIVPFVRSIDRVVDLPREAAPAVARSTSPLIRRIVQLDLTLFARRTI